MHDVVLVRPGEASRLQRAERLGTSDVLAIQHALVFFQAVHAVQSDDVMVRRESAVRVVKQHLEMG